MMGEEGAGVLVRAQNFESGSYSNASFAGPGIFNVCCRIALLVHSYSRIPGGGYSVRGKT